MNAGEEKNCPRCKVQFTCNVGGIKNCQCNTVKLSEKESELLQLNFEDCLCIKCLLEIKSISTDKTNS
jgi:hypothetical protein